MVIRFWPDPGLISTMKQALAKKDPFVTHGQDLYLKYDTFEVTVDESTLKGHVCLSFIYSYQGKRVGIFQGPTMKIGDSLTLDGVAGDIEMPVTFV